jgi:hypothetical protein
VSTALRVAPPVSSTVAYRRRIDTGEARPPVQEEAPAALPAPERAQLGVDLHVREIHNQCPRRHGRTLAMMYDISGCQGETAWTLHIREVVQLRLDLRVKARECLGMLALIIPGLGSPLIALVWHIKTDKRDAAGSDLDVVALQRALAQAAPLLGCLRRTPPPPHPCQMPRTKRPSHASAVRGDLSCCAIVSCWPLTQWNRGHSCPHSSNRSRNRGSTCSTMEGFAAQVYNTCPNQLIRGRA